MFSKIYYFSKINSTKHNNYSIQLDYSYIYIEGEFDDDEFELVNRLFQLVTDVV